MRTVATTPSTLPTIFLALDSDDTTFELETQLSNLGCNCVSLSKLIDLRHQLEDNRPELALIALDHTDRCALEFCEEHAQLLRQVPVVFVTNDPSDSFDRSIRAMQLGALDVVATPISDEKLEHVAEAARATFRSPKPTSEHWVGDIGDTSFSGSHRLPQLAANSFALPPTKDTAKAARKATSSVQVRYSSRPAAFGAASSVGPSTQAEHTRPCPQAAARRENHSARVKELETWILGSSPAMQSVRSTIAEVAETKANVMIYGASGTGKELVATAVHKLSDRYNGRFEPVNMTEIPHDLAESLLFGHERGSFTGADYRQIGVCEAADGGTLFLDEIGEMALATQPKLLRFLQEGTVKRIGSQTAKKVDVRVITATNRTPEAIVKEGLMREDLFFRLHVVPIHIPPLHERPEDIEQLAMLFLRRYVKAYKRNVEGFTKEALDIFRLHDWPGNVRQLENVVERLVVFAKGRLIEVPDIPAEIHAASMFGDSIAVDRSQNSGGMFANSLPHATAPQDDKAASVIASMSAIQRTERAAIIEALQRSDGHVIDAANLLGLGQATVYRKIKQYHIPHERRRRRRSPK